MFVTQNCWTPKTTTATHVPRYIVDRCHVCRTFSRLVTTTTRILWTNWTTPGRFSSWSKVTLSKSMWLNKSEVSFHSEPTPSSWRSRMCWAAQETTTAESMPTTTRITNSSKLLAHRPPFTPPKEHVSSNSKKKPVNDEAVPIRNVPDTKVSVHYLIAIITMNESHPSHTSLYDLPLHARLAPLVCFLERGFERTDFTLDDYSGCLFIAVRQKFLNIVPVADVVLKNSTFAHIVNQAIRVEARRVDRQVTLKNEHANFYIPRFTWDRFRSSVLGEPLCDLSSTKISKSEDLGVNNPNSLIYMRPV